VYEVKNKMVEHEEVREGRREGRNRLDAYQGDGWQQRCVFDRRLLDRRLQ
jgi:hypothetical protein